MTSGSGRRHSRSLVALAGGALALALAAWASACTGDNPAIAPGGDREGDGGVGTDGSGGEDGESARDFSFDPPSFDLAPGASATVRLRGSPELASVALSLVVEPIPDAGVPASAVTLGASSVSLETGEATFSLQAAADAPQQRFRVVGTAGAVTREASGRIQGRSGELDIFFGDHGGFFDSAPTLAGDCAAHAVAVQSDGRFVVVGTAEAGAKLLVARFTVEGALDPTFAEGKGFVRLAQGSGPRLEIMPDGAIAVAALDLGKLRLFRVDASGVPDPVWGGADGVATNLEGGGGISATLGKFGETVLVAGKVPSQSVTAVMRYLPDAGLDTTLDGDGVDETSLPPSTGTDPRVEALVVEPSGSYWIAGRYTPQTPPPTLASFVHRYQVDGSDAANVSGTYDGPVTALALQDGNAIASAYLPDDGNSIHAFRVTSDLDTTFGTDGKALVAAGSPGGYATGMVVDSARRIYLVNGATTAQNFDVYRLAPDGGLDDAFGALGTGLVRLPAGRAYGLAISGRQLIVVGVNDPTNPRSMRIARLWL